MSSAGSTVPMLSMLAGQHVIDHVLQQAEPPSLSGHQPGNQDEIEPDYPEAEVVPPMDGSAAAISYSNGEAIAVAMPTLPAFQSSSTAEEPAATGVGPHVIVTNDPLPVEIKGGAEDPAAHHCEILEASPAHMPSLSTAEEIFKFNELRNMGAVSEEEFQRAKGALMEHFGPNGVTLADVSGVRMPASVPSAVDDLPRYFLEREAQLLLKEALLDGDQQGSQRTKMVAQGVSGVGKTVLATALVQHEDFRATFDTIVWLEVGATPNIRKLQESAYFQLTNEEMPAPAKTPELAKQAIRTAARGRTVFQVLDDCWNPEHAKLLTFSDNPASRLLITTRLRGLLPSAHEVNVDVLSRGEALQLLLSSAKGGAAFEDGSKEMQIASEVVQLCGSLPEMLSIVGSLILDCGVGFGEEVLEIWKRSGRNTLLRKDEDGMVREDGNAYYCFGARAFLKLGVDDEAYDLAKSMISSPQEKEGENSLVVSYSILGQIAAKRGELDEADGFFATALAEAERSGIPMLELLAARDWKAFLLVPQGLDLTRTEEAIHGACARMGKSREQLASFLKVAPPTARSARLGTTTITCACGRSSVAFSEPAAFGLECCCVDCRQHVQWCESKGGKPLSSRHPIRLQYFKNDMAVISGQENLRTYKLRSWARGGRSRRVCCTHCSSTLFVDHPVYLGKFAMVPIDYCGVISPPSNFESSALNVAGEWPITFTPLKDTGREPYRHGHVFFSHTVCHGYGGLDYIGYFAPYLISYQSQDQSSPYKHVLNTTAQRIIEHSGKTEVLDLSEGQVLTGTEKGDYLELVVHSTPKTWKMFRVTYFNSLAVAVVVFIAHVFAMSLQVT